MNINELVVTTLKPLNVPVVFQSYTGKQYPHITFFEYMEQDSCWANNEKVSTEHYVQIDIWSVSDYSDLKDSVLELMHAAGFIKRNSSDIFESGILSNHIDVFHRIIRFVINENF